MSPLSTINPFDHPCDLSELDYSRVEDGLIICTTCSRQWRLRSIDHGAVWDNSAPTRMPGGHGPHFWTSDLKPYPKPTAEEILANRQARLDMLDQKAAEKRRLFEDSRDGLDWLAKERAKEAGPSGVLDHEWLAAAIAQERAPKRRRIVSPAFNGRIRITLRFTTPEACMAFVGKMISVANPDRAKLIDGS